jgi:hypothetical protein
MEVPIRWSLEVEIPTQKMDGMETSSIKMNRSSISRINELFLPEAKPLRVNRS